MGVTEHEIVRSATKLFNERGFPSTSIQDIAVDCQIAKGSVYKYFSSKEDLFNEVFNRCQNRFFDQAEQIKQIPGLSTRERFLRQIIFRFQYFIENKFILIDFQEIPIAQNPKFIPLRHRVRARFMNWHKECLLEVHGPEIEPHLVDLATIYKAFLREYMFWVIREDNPLSIERTAKFIAEKIDVLAKDFIYRQPEPLLNPDSIDQFLNEVLNEGKQEKEQAIKNLSENIHRQIQALPSGKAHRDEVEEVFLLLEEELKKSEPKRPLILALLAYLEMEPLLTSLIKQLKNIID